jgi:hypothetical protein
MLDGWLKAAGIELDDTAHEGPQGEAPQVERHFDAARWTKFGGSRRRRRSSSSSSYAPGSLKAARLQRAALFGVALLFACATAFFVLSGESGAMSQERETAALPTSAGPEKPAWIPVIRPIHLFALEAPELIKAAANYDAVRSTTSDGREDNLSFGSAARVDALFMRVSVYRLGSEAKDPAPFFVDLSRRAASVGLAVGKTTPGEAMPTKFGDMEIAEIKLTMNEVERSCLAFRRALPGEKLRLAGWYCAPAGSFAGRAGLSCLINRLALLSAGDDDTLRDSFVAAERRRPAACGKGPLLAASAGIAPLPAEIGPTRLRGIKAR